MISAHGLSKRYGYRVALQHVNLQVKAGEIVALLGPNGAGKSTLLRLLAGLAKPSAGTITIAGHRIPDEAVQARATIGYVGHQPLLYEDLSAEQNLAFIARLYGLENGRDRIDELLEIFDLENRRREPVRNFSRGMQQRLALARALLHQPRLLLLDEPHSGLDRKAAKTLDDVLRTQATTGSAVLFATHDVNHAQELAKRILVITNGRLIGALPKSSISARRATAYYDKLMLRANV